MTAPRIKVDSDSEAAQIGEGAWRELLRVYGMLERVNQSTFSVNRSSNEISAGAQSILQGTQVGEPLFPKDLRSEGSDVQGGVVVVGGVAQPHDRRRSRSPARGDREQRKQRAEQDGGRSHDIPPLACENKLTFRPD